MKRYKKQAFVLSAALIIMLLGGCSPKKNQVTEEKEETSQMTETTETVGESGQNGSAGLLSAEYDAQDLNDSWSSDAGVIITCNGSTAEISGEGATAEGSIVTITKAGTYVFSGDLENGQIRVDSSKEDMVHIVLNGLTATASDSAAVYGVQSEKIILTLATGTTNTLTDVSAYVYADASEDEPNACVFSKDDITINGSGTLIVKGNYQDGIRSKDDIKIVAGDIQVTAVENGIKGKDSVVVRDGSIWVEAGADGIKANNSADAGRGYILLEGGSYNITAGQDGIQAETVLQIDGGQGTVTTGGGSANASYDANGQVNEAWGSWGGQMGGAQPQGGDASAGQTENEVSETESNSAKGLKAGTNLYLNGGEYVIDSSDDSIHCNGAVEISGGSCRMSSGDDGVHADNSLLITGGSLDVEKSFEGLEGSTVEIKGGDIKVYAYDDGINSAGGSDTGITGRPGENNFASGSDYWIRISGGTLYVNADGDGIDSNGNLYIDDGTIIVEGPENSGNGTLDYEGAAQITGGTFIGNGMSGMALGFGDTSTQYSVVLVLDTAIDAGRTVTVNDSTGKEMLSLTTSKSGNCILFSSPELKAGETYTVACSDGTQEEVTIQEISTWIGRGGMGQGGNAPDNMPSEGMMPENGVMGR